MGAARVTYGLGWVLLIIALVERILIMTSPAIAQSAIHRSVLPYNFLELSFLFFVISIASGHCCPRPEQK